MYGSPGLPRDFPPLNAQTPHIVLLNGRPWLSSIGLAQILGRPHTEVLAAITRMDLSPAFRAEHFRRSTVESGACGPGVWISRDGADLLRLTWRQEPVAAWQVVDEAFRAVSRSSPPKAVPSVSPARAWLERLCARVMRRSA